MYWTARAWRGVSRRHPEIVRHIRDVGKEGQRENEGASRHRTVRTARARVPATRKVRETEAD